jgi:hypothetical protein
MLLWVVPILLSGVILGWMLWPRPQTSYDGPGYDDIVTVIRIITGVTAITLVWTAALLLNLLVP